VRTHWEKKKGEKRKEERKEKEADGSDDCAT
jgi:hypothetical protein